MTRANRPSRSRFQRSLELVLGLALFVLLLASVDADRLLQALRTADPALAMAGAGAFFLMAGIDAWRMKLAFRHYRLGYRRCLQIQAAGFFLSSFTPGMAGADILKVGVAHRIEAGISGPIALTLLLRVLGMAVLLAGTLAWMALFPERLAHLEDRLGFSQHFAAAPLELILVLGAVAVMLLLLASWSQRIRGLARSAWQAITEIGPWGIGRLVGSTLAMVAAGALSLLLFACSVDIAARAADMVVVLTLLTLGSLIPLGPGGLGLREGAISAGLVAFGAPFSAALAVALLHRASFWAVALVGWAVVLRWRRIGDS